MAWIHGNTPTTEDTLEGRMLCEAMYACNEKEEALGMAQSTWNGGAIAAKPAMNALLGLTAFKTPTGVTVGGQIHKELQAAITAIVARTTRPYFVDAGGNYYTLATLCTAAFGGVGFTTVAGADCEDVTLISEILKALETLDRIDAALITPEAGTRKGRKSEYHVPGGPGQPTRDGARILVAGYVADIGAMSEISDWDFAPELYYWYEIVEVYHKAEFNLPRFGSVDTVFLRYQTAEVNPFDITSSPRLFNISAAEYAAANTPGPEGDLVLTFTYSPVGYHTVELADSSWLISAGPGIYYYWKGVRAASCPWPDDTIYYLYRVHYDAPAASTGFYCRYYGAWTYN